MKPGPDENKNDSAPEEQRTKPSILDMALSVIQASFGVQSKKNRQRDFESGSFKGFIISALFFTVIFVIVLILVVKTVLAS